MERRREKNCSNCFPKMFDKSRSNCPLSNPLKCTYVHLSNKGAVHMNGKFNLMVGKFNLNKQSGHLCLVCSFELPLRHAHGSLFQCGGAWFIIFNQNCVNHSSKVYHLSVSTALFKMSGRQSTVRFQISRPSAIFKGYEFAHERFLIFHLFSMVGFGILCAALSKYFSDRSHYYQP